MRLLISGITITKLKNLSLNELIYELMELRREYIKDTDSLDRRLVVNWIQTTRARLIKQKLDNQTFTPIDDHYVQDLGKIEMTKVLSNDVGIDNYDYMWRTSIEIPRTVDSKEGKGTFTRIGPADKLSDPFQILPYNQALVAGYGKFNFNTIYAFVLGDYVYLVSNGGLHFTVKYLNIRGVFQDPILAARIPDPTWGYDDDYPVNMEIVDQMKTMIVQTKFALVLEQAHDKTDDREDNPEGHPSIPKGQGQGQG